MSHKKPKFYACETCKTVIEVISNDKQEYSCCGVKLKKLVPNTSEGAQEKHLPVVEQNGNTITVKVGSVLHPMTEEHSIEWVYLETKKGCQRVYLCADAKPQATFTLAEDDAPIAAYAFCNLHGFWKVDIE